MEQLNVNVSFLLKVWRIHPRSFIDLKILLDYMWEVGLFLTFKMPRRFKLIGCLTLAVCLTDLTAIAAIMPALVSWALKQSLYGQNPNNLLSLMSFMRRHCRRKTSKFRQTPRYSCGYLYFVLFVFGYWFWPL